MAWSTGDKAGKFLLGKGDKVRYPNIGGEEPKQEQVPGNSEAKNLKKVEDKGLEEGSVEERSSSEQ